MSSKSAASQPTGNRLDRNLSELASNQTDKTSPGEVGCHDHTEASPATDWPVIPKERFGVFLWPLRAILGRVGTPLVCEILRECRNLPLRIRKIFVTKIYVYGVLLGTLRGETLASLQTALTQACMRDMQEILPDDSKATLLDRLLFAQGWRCGAKSAMDEMVRRDWSKEHLSQEASYLQQWGNGLIPPEWRKHFTPSSGQGSNHIAAPSTQQDANDGSIPNSCIS